MKKKKSIGKESPRREPLHVIRRKPSPPAPPPPPKVVSPEKLKRGLEEKKRDLQTATDDLTQFFRICPGVKEVEVPLSFDNEGKFLGFGMGGAITMKIHVKVER